MKKQLLKMSLAKVVTGIIFSAFSVGINAQTQITINGARIADLTGMYSLNRGGATYNQVLIGPGALELEITGAPVTAGIKVVAYRTDNNYTTPLTSPMSIYYSNDAKVWRSPGVTEPAGSSSNSYDSTARHFWKVLGINSSNNMELGTFYPGNPNACTWESSLLIRLPEMAFTEWTLLLVLILTRPNLSCNPLPISVC